MYFKVSVSLWSYIHSYKLNTNYFIHKTEQLVFVSLRSYIHSYFGGINMLTREEMMVSVSLQSYIHSYLLDFNFIKNGGPSRFSSPYGVIFILTIMDEFLDRYNVTDGFRLLTEYHSFLLVEKKQRYQKI